MPDIIVFDRSGEKRNLDLPIGGSLMEALRDSGYDDIIAICGGNCTCATCHVYIEPLNQNTLPSVSEDEQVLIESLAHSKPNSRLSCQIEINEFLSGSVVRIPPEE